MKEIREKIRVVVVDDSVQYRSQLCRLLSGHPRITIIGEAVNGIEALDVIWNIKPDVVLMDFEMPIMDGMTALQHLMIHIPTPTIMFSHLTREGTARCFDALKNGAVDFFCKDNLPMTQSDAVVMQDLAERVICASHVSVKAVEPIFPKSPMTDSAAKLMKTLVFCEECGAKTEAVIRENEDQGGVLCSQCGEHIPLEQRNRFRRANYLSILVGGEGAYINLLKLVPQLPQDINGALLVLIDGTVEHVDSFTRYLDSISTVKVLRYTEGVAVQGGNCYVGCENEFIVLKPFSAEHTLQTDSLPNDGESSIDRTMNSVAQVFKNRTSVIFLSGNEQQGSRGIREIVSHEGQVIVLSPKRCLYKNMTRYVMDNFAHEIVTSEEVLCHRISSLHMRYRDTIVTA